MTRTDSGVGPEAFDGLDERVNGSVRFRVTHRRDGSRGLFDDMDPPPGGGAGGRGVASRPCRRGIPPRTRRSAFVSQMRTSATTSPTRAPETTGISGQKPARFVSAGRSCSPALVGDNRTESTDWRSSSGVSPPRSPSVAASSSGLVCRDPGQLLFEPTCHLLATELQVLGPHREIRLRQRVRDLCRPLAIGIGHPNLEHAGLLGSRDRDLAPDVLVLRQAEVRPVWPRWRVRRTPWRPRCRW